MTSSFSTHHSVGKQLSLSEKTALENAQDLNRGFPPQAGRTPLAKTRTYLAAFRSTLAAHRTAMAKGRTGLAFLRTGIAFITISVTLLRLFDSGYLLPVDFLLLILGAAAMYDGMLWYLPSRREAADAPILNETGRPSGISVLETIDEETEPAFVRSGPVAGAVDLREAWEELSPVERRRFLANDRTDMAEERTVLASLRTTMAQARTGLAFTRSGVAFAGIGIALLRKFPGGNWAFFDAALIVAGSLMALEGLRWYVPGYRAGREGLIKFTRSLKQQSIWEDVFPSGRQFRETCPPVEASHAPGIWGTTGLALERTLIAERRNLMARIRTVMSYSRTGLAFIRTGMSVSAVGAGLLVFLNTGSTAWSIFDTALLAIGATFVLDGIRWYRRSEAIRKGFPYCYGDFEICLPFYGTPARSWAKVIYSHDA